jgi:hypothetical protein
LPPTVVLAKFKAKHLYCANTLLKIKKTHNKNMKITITKTIQETHELELPAYRKNSCHYFKIVSETVAILVCTYQNGESIAMSATSSALNLAPLQSSAEEFDAMFNQVFTLISQKASI